MCYRRFREMDFVMREHGHICTHEAFEVHCFCHEGMRHV